MATERNSLLTTKYVVRLWSAGKFGRHPPLQPQARHKMWSLSGGGPFHAPTCAVNVEVGRPEEKVVVGIS